MRQLDDVADDPASAKQKKKREDADAISGLRSPHKSIKRVGGAAAVGQRLKIATDTCNTKHGKELAEALDSLDK